MKTKEIVIWMAVAGALMGAAWIFPTKSTATIENPVEFGRGIIPMVPAPTGPVEGKQIVEVTAKEGYQPVEILVKAGMPIILEMKTNGTFDCSTTFSLPQFKFRATLPATGSAAFEIPAQKAGDSIYGVCGMGMYHFVIKFT